MIAGLAINAVWAVTLWSLCAAALVFALRRGRAAVRRDVCRLALGGVPVVLAVVAAMHVLRPGAGLVDWRVEAPAAGRPAAGPPERPASTEHGEAHGPGASAEAEAYAFEEVELPDEPAAEPAATAPSEAAPGAAHASAPTAGAEVPPRRGWAKALVLGAIWITAALLAALAHRVAVLALWRRTWRPASRGWASLARRLADRMGLKGPVAVYVVPGLSQPAAAGVLRPAILLPADGGGISPALRGALLHELGHLAGADPLWGLVGRGAAALAWWCPAVWLLHRRAQVEAEVTADDCALESGTRPTDLARALLAFAERIQVPAPPGVPGMGCYLKRRVEMMIDKKRSHNSKVAGRLRCLLGCMALVLAWSLAATPLVGVSPAEAAEPAAALAAAAPVVVVAPPEPAGESALAVAIARNRAQITAVRKDRDEAREKLYAARHRFEKVEAVVALRRAAAEASAAYEKIKDTDPDLKAAGEAEDALNKALDAMVQAKVKASGEGAALVQKAADLEEERAALSLVHAIATVKLTHRDSPVTRALDKDEKLAALHNVYRRAEQGPVRDEARAAYYAARKAALARMPEAQALTAEMDAAKKGMDAAYKAAYEAARELRKMQDRIKYNREDAEVAAAYKKLTEARKAVEKASTAAGIQAARDARTETYKACSAKIKELMAADPEASALTAKYNRLDKELDDLEDEARELKKKQRPSPKRTDRL